MEFIRGKNEIIARKHFKRPSIYLDHWAIRLFSDDVGLQDRLVDSIKSKNGSLSFSPMNLAEFSKMESSISARRAEAFLDRLLPDVFLTSFDSSVVENFCNSPQYTGQRFNLPPDQSGFKIFATMCLDNGGTWSFSGLLTASPEQTAKLKNTIDLVNSELLSAIRVQQCKAESVRKAKNASPSAYATPLQFSLGELLRELILAKDANITLNDMSDLQHALLTIICCNFVLLDAKWHNKVDAIKQRLRQANVNRELANTYSLRNHGVTRFLEDLESFTALPGA